MSIILYGVTSGGTSVPIEVTDEGKLVVDTSNLLKQGDDIEAGSITATSVIKTDNRLEVNVAGDKGNADDTFISYQEDGSTAGVSMTGGGAITAAGGATFAGTGIFGRDADNGANPGIRLASVGAIAACRAAGNTAVFSGYTEGNRTPQLSFLANGSITSAGSAVFAGQVTAADAQAGFTSDGELYFYSRGTRYKAVVQGGNMAAEPFTRATELQEKAAQLREKAEDLKEPRTLDIVPGD